MLKGILFDISPSESDSAFLPFLLEDLCSWGLQYRTNPDKASPNVKLYRDMVHDLAFPPTDCLIITDSADGVCAAKAAGIPCIGYEPPGCSANLSGAYAVIQGFRGTDPGYLCRTHAHALSYPAQIICTERLIIRELSEEDFPALYAMSTESDTAAFMEETLSDYDTEYKKHLAYLHNIYPFFELALWGVYKRESGQLIGRAGFSLPKDDSDTYWLGYFIDVPYRRKGYATECIPAILHFASCQGCYSVSAKIRKNNPISEKVLKRCRFPYQCISETSDSLIYRIDLE